jgi:hypothetical protein
MTQADQLLDKFLECHRHLNDELRDECIAHLALDGANAEYMRGRLLVHLGQDPVLTVKLARQLLPHDASFPASLCEWIKTGQGQGAWEQPWVWSHLLEYAVQTGTALPLEGVDRLLLLHGEENVFVLKSLCRYLWALPAERQRLLPPHPPPLLLLMQQQSLSPCHMDMEMTMNKGSVISRSRRTADDLIHCMDRAMSYRMPLMDLEPILPDGDLADSGPGDHHHSCQYDCPDY